MSQPSSPSPDGQSLRALFLNCTLKRSPRMSHTDGLIAASQHIMEQEGVTVEALRPVDLVIATGMQPDMTEEGWERDDWPDVFQRVMACDILVVTSPIWIGAPSSVCRLVLERLYADSGQTNDAGQPIYYGRTAGCLTSGNEDGVKHCGREILYCLQHLGFLVPPQADAGWIGEAGPGKSYRDEGSHGPDNDFTNRTVTAMSWNLIHAARMLKAAGGIPARGTSSEAWKDGEHFGHPGPEAIRGLRGGPSQLVSAPATGEGA